MKTVERRLKMGRIRHSLSVKLITSDDHEIAVKVTDISRDGFRIEHVGADLLVGEIVTIRSARSESRGQILWVNDSQAGAAFIDAPATPA